MAFARHLSLQTLDFLVGDTGKLEREDALLAVSSAMASDGHVKETTNILTWVLQSEISPDKVRAAVEETHLFAGFPRCLNALYALQDAADKAGVAVPPGEVDAKRSALDEAAQEAQGRELWNQVYTEHSDEVLKRVADASAEAARWSLAHAYGRVLSRDVLEPLQRELCVVAALIPMDVQPQLKGHVMGARQLGASDDQLWDLLALIRKFFDAEQLLDRTQSTFESVLGNKPGGLSLEEERKYDW